MRPYRETSRCLAAEVVKADWSRSTFARCTVDVFEADTLTVTSLDDERVMATYPPGTWRTGTAFGRDGYPLFSFISHAEEARLQGAASLDLHAGEL